MFGLFADAAGGWKGCGSVAALSATQARLLWAIRRLALMQPIEAARCHAVHIALQQDFGDDGQGIEHLLRCIIVGLARTATRRLVIGAPGAGILMADEAILLALLSGTAGWTVLVALTGTDEAARLLPLFWAVCDLAGE